MKKHNATLRDGRNLKGHMDLQLFADEGKENNTDVTDVEDNPT